MKCPLPITRPLIAFIAVIGLAGTPAVASAQSLFAQRGLGLIFEPQSARSAGLGGVTLGLPGLEIPWNNPAAAVGLPAAGLLVGAQVDGFQASYSGLETSGTTTRFPVIVAAIPFGRKFAVTAGFGTFLDQRWAIEHRDTLIVDSDSLGVTDRVSSDGGVSRLRVGGGYLIAPNLSIGLGLDLYTGGTDRVTARYFSGQPTPGCCSAQWEYSGTGALASLDWYPSPALRVSFAGSAGGTLKAKPKSDDKVSVASDYSMPATVSLGASGRVTANTLIAASAGWSGWSSVDESLAGAGGARDIWSAHGGLEWDALAILGRPVPLRVGGRYQGLPFRAERATDAPWSAEKAFSLGTGVVLGGGAARTDFSLERGRRGGVSDGLEESFWRFNFSVSVLGQ